MSLQVAPEAGLSKFANVVLILFIVTGGFFGAQAVTHLYRYQEIKGLIEFQVKRADLRTDKKIRRIIEAEMRSLGINAEKEDLIIESGPSSIAISLSYDEYIEIYLNEDYNWLIHTLEFDVDEEGATTAVRARE